MGRFGTGRVPPPLRARPRWPPCRGVAAPPAQGRLAPARRRRKAAPRPSVQDGRPGTARLSSPPAGAAASRPPPAVESRRALRGEVAPRGGGGAVVGSMRAGGSPRPGLPRPLTPPLGKGGARGPPTQPPAEAAAAAWRNAPPRVAAGCRASAGGCRHPAPAGRGLLGTARPYPPAPPRLPSGIPGGSDDVFSQAFQTHLQVVPSAAASGNSLWSSFPLCPALTRGRRRRCPLSRPSCLSRPAGAAPSCPPRAWPWGAVPAGPERPRGSPARRNKSAWRCVETSPSAAGSTALCWLNPPVRGSPGELRAALEVPGTAASVGERRAFVLGGSGLTRRNPPVVRAVPFTVAIVSLVMFGWWHE